MARLFTLIAAVLAAATLVGLILLWPGQVESQVAQGVAVESEKATVTTVEEGLCVGFSGQHVSQGEVIGSSGCTGHCLGPHVHFEVRVNGSPVDPLGYL